MLNFTNEIEKYTTTARTTRQSEFTDFASKKKLTECSFLEAEKLDFLLKLKNTFTFSIHNGGRYAAVTLYKANAEQKYSFIVVDLQEELIAEVASIKQAKQEILSIR